MKKNIAILSNVTIDMVAAKLRKNYDVYFPDGFDMWISEVLNQDSFIYSDKVQAVAVLLDGTEFRSMKSNEEFNQRVGLWKSVLLRLAENIKEIPVFISTIDFRESAIRTYSERKYYTSWNDAWYQFVQSLSENKKNIYVLDILQRIQNEGRNTFYSNKMWYMGSMPYSKNGLLAVTDEICKALSSAFDSRRKIVVLDLDNTLWGGVIGEDGINGIDLSEHKEGARYYDFQLRLKEMRDRGILLAVNSKNNNDEAVEAIEKHPHMILHDSDFVSKKINWNDKASNIKEMESELNLTEGSFVFVDDNPVEREVVGGQCQDVLVAEFPDDSSDLINMIEKLYENEFKSLRLTDEDRTKTEMYQTEAKRKEIQSSALNLDDYIKVLEMRADIHIMHDEELERVHQLCNKTNQFNLTTKRYTQKEIADMSSDKKYDIFTVSSSDKFGDNGLVGVVICKKEGVTVTIDTFLMSCRVMGRKLENVIMSVLIGYYKDNFERIVGEYIPTKKNIPVKDKYGELGFNNIEFTGSKTLWKFKTSTCYPNVVSYSEILFNGVKQ